MLVVKNANGVWVFFDYYAKLYKACYFEWNVTNECFIKDVEIRGVIYSICNVLKAARYRLLTQKNGVNNRFKQAQYGIKHLAKIELEIQQNFFWGIEGFTFNTLCK